MGNYTITFEPYVDVLTDPLNGQQYVPVMVVVSDERGILVEASTYNYIGFAVQKNTPNTLYYNYYDSIKRRYVSVSVPRPDKTPFEVYTLEMSSNLSLYWLGSKLAVSSSLKLPPFPVMPIKQIRVNATIDGKRNTLREIPIQYENWTTVSWYGMSVDVPVGLSDPQMDFVRGDRFNTRLVFQVSYPTLSLKKQLVVLWWSDDLDAQPAVYSTQIGYDPTEKKVSHPLYNVEFVDTEHPQAKDYDSYYGVAALIMRNPDDSAFGPYNLHAFDKYDSSLGRYRPYGKWDVYYEYMRYSWIQAPIRIFAVLKDPFTGGVSTRWVGNVYSSGDVRNDYYYTLSIVQIVNNTRYIPVTTYIYWNKTQSGKGYWFAMMTGAGQASWFSYLDKYNSTNETPFAWSRTSVQKPNPGFMLAMWGNSFGRAIYLTNASLNAFYNSSAVAGSRYFECTMFNPQGNRQGSLEYMINGSLGVSVPPKTRLSYTAVIFDFRWGDTGWISCSDTDCWKNAYIYAPMFLERYAPAVVPP